MGRLSAVLATQLRTLIRTDADGGYYTPRDELLANSADALETQELPPWVGEFLNRRTEVERVLRAPMAARNKGKPEPEALTPEQMWELANRLSVPAEFGEPRP